MLNIKVYLSNIFITDELSLKDKNVVIVDVLRATTSMTVALASGAKEIIPVDNVSTAARIAKGTGNSLLCGERSGKKIEGFNLGNSPSEFTEEVVKDKSLVFSTTNGTVSILKAKYAKNCILCSFVNLDAVVDALAKLSEDIIIICSGKQNDFCVEDAVCSGVIINKLLEKNPNYEIDDPELAVSSLAEFFLKNSISKESINSMLQKTEHGKFLKELGMEKDLSDCSDVNSCSILPIYANGVIKSKDALDNEIVQKSQMKKVNIAKSEQTKAKSPDLSGHESK